MPLAPKMMRQFEIPVASIPCSRIVGSFASDPPTRCGAATASMRALPAWTWGSAALPQVQAGNARMLAVAAPQRIGGSLAKLPTMREQGIEATGISNWRIIFGAKGITAPQASFWEDALAKVVTTADWKHQLAENNLESRFMRGRELAKWLEGEYAATRAVMTDLGIVK